MGRLVIGAPVHNNLKYTKLFLESIKCSNTHEVLIIDNGSTDDTLTFLKDSGINHIHYEQNRGYSYAYNDAMDYALTDDDNLLLWCGNDIVLRPCSIDWLVRAITESDYEMLCGNEILNKEILTVNPGAYKEFGYKFGFNEPKYTELKYGSGGMNHSCLIRKKSVFDKVGYYDVNFFPAYFEDNDYARRCDLLGIKYGTVESALFYHFWSRSIYEGGLKQLNSERFGKNRAYYISKWGGAPKQETYDKPFGSDSIPILSRKYESRVLESLGAL